MSDNETRPADVQSGATLHALFAAVKRLLEQTESDRATVERLQAEKAVDLAHAANLEQALVSARRIGLAVGIVMERLKLTDDRAFAVLVEIGHDTDRPLREVAEDVIFDRASLNP